MSSLLCVSIHRKMIEHCFKIRKGEKVIDTKKTSMIRAVKRVCSALIVWSIVRFLARVIIL